MCMASMGLCCFLEILKVSMKFPSYGLVYDYSLEDGGVSRKHSKDDDDEDQHTEEVRGRISCLKGKRTHLTT